MTIGAKDVTTWIGIIVAIAGAGTSYGVNGEKIRQLENDNETAKLTREQQIRMEERQKQIQENQNTIKGDLQEIKRLLIGNGQ